MQLTENDKLFLAQLQIASRENRESGQKVALVTSKSMISEDLLKIFEVGSNAQGAWFFNVYVEFEPMFKTQAAKDWQV